MVISSTWSEYLKVISGKNFDEIKATKGVCDLIKDEVSCIAYYDHLSLIATGTTCGIA